MNVEAIQAGATVKFNIPGRNFRLIETTGPVNVTFYRRGAEIAESVQVEAGYSEKWEQDSEGFEQVEFYSATAQTIKFAVRMESSVSYDRAVGNVAVTNTGGTFNNTAKTVTNASGGFLSANTLRRYLLIQNKSASGNIWVCFGNGPATTANGVKIPPGGSYEMQGFAPTNNIQAIGDIASNPEVLVVEG
ncbi:hypothetical protein [Methyloversatilis sp.]|uniref:hypothetical protein n=1 Tax=Methyloversatilis sp. TaxID=2569862 RepID=UPI003D27EA39